MRNALVLMFSLLVVGGLLSAGCRPDSRRDEGVSAKVTDERGAEPEYTPAWNQIRRGMTADEVLLLLGHPKTIRVSQTSTCWYYSDRGADGPHVCFDTRPMQVATWRPPADKPGRP
jgi:outer membrane protein assembly factor BamE (lipoprotein component of BamABCDE complex)